MEKIDSAVKKIDKGYETIYLVVYMKKKKLRKNVLVLILEVWNKQNQMVLIFSDQKNKKRKIQHFYSLKFHWNGRS